MITISVTADINRTLAFLRTNRFDQVPFATATALTRTAQKVKEAEVEAMKKVFDRPTAYTLNGLYVTPATKRNLQANVYFKDFSPKGVAAGRYLRPQIDGGSRNQKRFERALILKGLMPAGSYAVPGRQAPLDQFGNVPASFFVRILSDLQAFGEQGYRANRRGARRGARRDNYFFVPKKGSSLRPGVYWHLPNRMLVVVFVFVSRVAYQKRFDFYGIGRKVQAAEFPSQFERAMQEALRSAL
jgi:hypothetical protein